MSETGERTNGAYVVLYSFVFRINVTSCNSIVSERKLTCCLLAASNTSIKSVFQLNAHISLVGPDPENFTAEFAEGAEKNESRKKGNK